MKIKIPVHYYSVVVLLIVAISGSGCSSLRYKKMAQIAAEENRWEYAVAYYEKACKKSLLKKKAGKLVKQAKENAAYYYYHEALYSVRHKSDFLEDLKRAKKDICKALNYKPYDKEYNKLANSINAAVKTLKRKVETSFTEYKDLIRKNKFLEALTLCDEILYIDSHNNKARKLKERVIGKGAVYYLKEGIKEEKNENFNSSIQFIEYSIEIRKTEAAVALLTRVTKKMRARRLFNTIQQKIVRGGETSALKQLRKMVSLDNTNNRYRELLLKGLTKKVSDAMAKGKNRLALDVIAEIKTVGEKKAKLLKALKPVEKKLVNRIKKIAENDLVNNLPGNALESFIWLDQRNLLEEKGQALLENTMADVLQNAVPTLKLAGFSGHNNDLRDKGAQLANGLFEKIYKNKVIKCMIYITDEPEIDRKSDIRLKYAEPVTDFSRYMGSLKGTSLILNGSVESATFRHSIDKVETEKPYISHYQKIVNPDYIEYINREIDDNQTHNSDALAALDLFFDVMSEIMKPDKYIEQPVYRHHRYTVEEHHVDTSINFTIFLTDDKTGHVLLKKTFSETLNLKDTYVPGSTKAKISRDPLDLAGDYNIRQQLINSAVNKALDEINALLGRLPELFRLKAKTEKENGNLKLAREYSVMASVSETPLLLLADALWPSEQPEVFMLIDDDKDVRVETLDGEASDLMDGDLIVKINDIDVSDRAHAIQLLGTLAHGALVKITIINESDTLKSVEILNPVKTTNHLLRL